MTGKPTSIRHGKSIGVQHETLGCRASMDPWQSKAIHCFPIGAHRELFRGRTDEGGDGGTQDWALLICYCHQLSAKVIALKHAARKAVSSCSGNVNISF